MTRLILIEDEPVLREELSDFLASFGHEVKAVGGIAEFRQCFAPNDHLIAIVDLSLPDGSGLDLIAQLRAEGHQLGVIVLTARIGSNDKVTGLVGGADYYLAKTAQLQELAATVVALARRLGDEAPPRWVLRGSPRQLIPPGFAPIPLSEQDYKVLRALSAGGQTVTRQAIVAALGANYLDYDQRRLDTQMRRLRRKVEQGCGLDLPVSTVRSVGFRFHARIDVFE
ncbi:MAG: response regulator transcription factor [Rhodocyclaceae bacterium]|nr:response regulator transcription factor [Rhodocyclaceae bacterium]